MNEQMKAHNDAITRRNNLESTIGGNVSAINIFKRILSGEQPISRERLIIAAHDGIDLMAQYRQRLANAERKIAEARAELADLVIPPRPEMLDKGESRLMYFGKRGNLRFLAMDEAYRELIPAHKSGVAFS